MPPPTDPLFYEWKKMRESKRARELVVKTRQNQHFVLLVCVRHLLPLPHLHEESSCCVFFSLAPFSFPKKKIRMFKPNDWTFFQCCSVPIVCNNRDKHTLAQTIYLEIFLGFVHKVSLNPNSDDWCFVFLVCASPFATKVRVRWWAEGWRGTVKMRT